jgi:N-carbamoylputrescine amidase
MTEMGTASDTELRVALVTDVFFDDADGSRLGASLAEARRLGAEIVVLPELPLNSWAPGSRVPRAEDAEAFDTGPRQERMASAARDNGIALVGGAIVVDERSRKRHNTALLYDADGVRVAWYRKIHLPEEEGYWETDHYEPGDRAPEVCDALPLRVGLQVCSDVNRPQGFQLLAAQSVEAVFVPRATPGESWDRWRMVLRANAVMSGAFVVSVNRPGPEPGASIGGPSIAISPTGEVLTETDDPVRVVSLDRRSVREAAGEYPGYLPRNAALYQEGWTRVGYHPDRVRSGPTSTRPGRRDGRGDSA